MKSVLTATEFAHLLPRRLNPLGLPTSVFIMFAGAGKAQFQTIFLETYKTVENQYFYLTIYHNVKQRLNFHLVQISSKSDTF